MGERNAENADLAVEELKRKARRRLVGAIVLALAAAIILPLLLEREPKPLGDDVSVKIPPVDEGKFVNRLTGRASETKSAAKAAPKNETRAEPAAESKSDSAAPGPSAAVAPAPDVASTPAPPATTIDATAAAPGPVAPPKKSVSQAEQRVLSPADKPTNKPDAPPVAPAKTDSTSATPAPSPAPASATAPSPTPASAATAPSPVLATAPPPTPAKTEPDTATATKVEGFAVQIAAFTDDKGANALAGKLKKAGFASTYIEPVQTSRGTLWRVRVGGYSARAEADAARAKLKADGWNGIVVMAK